MRGGKISPVCIYPPALCHSFCPGLCYNPVGSTMILMKMVSSLTCADFLSSSLESVQNSGHPLAMFMSLRGRLPVTGINNINIPIIILGKKISSVELNTFISVCDTI